MSFAGEQHCGGCLESPACPYIRFETSGKTRCLPWHEERALAVNTWSVDVEAWPDVALNLSFNLGRVIESWNLSEQNQRYTGTEGQLVKLPSSHTLFMSHCCRRRARGFHGTSWPEFMKRWVVRVLGNGHRCWMLSVEKRGC